MRKIFTAFVIAALAGAAVSSCGGSHKGGEAQADEEVVVEKQSQLEQALSSGNLREASVMADSMSLFVDDFTPEQTVQVLTAFISIHNDAVAKRETRRDLETLRKYVDVYDIALSVNPNDTRAAFKKAHSRNPEIDFDSVAKNFRERLAQYDSMQDGSLVKAPAQTDSATAAPDSTAAAPAKPELPLELRPAE